MSRAAVVAEAESWIGTPYHSNARLKGVGVDCAMLIAEVYERAGVVAHVDPGDYPADFGMHRADEVFRGWVAKYGTSVATPQAGDVALFVYGRCYSHGAIMTSETALIHAVMRERAVTRGDLSDAGLVDRKALFFTLWREG